MAQFLAARGWAPPDPLTLHLREMLDEGFFIVAAPRINGHAMDAIVVAPTGLYVLYPRWWLGDIRVAANGKWMTTAGSNGAVELPSPADEIQRCQRALDAFLRDEFPGLQPPIHHVVVLMSPEAKPAIEVDVWPRLTTLDALGEVMMGTQLLNSQEDELRQQMAFALRDRQLTHSQRANEPFIFRTGSRSTWTIGEAILHMDRQPADGIYHLRNGTLIRWLRHEGAEYLAVLAEDVMRQVVSDDRAMLETFLIETKVVARPTMTMNPTRVDLGPILSGDSAGAVVRIQQKSGRGYLFGSLNGCEPWVRVDPEHFAGVPVDVAISIDTALLPIRAAPYIATVQVLSSASNVPQPISVRFQVVGIRSKLERYFLRPLLSAIVTGMIGLCLGLLAGFAVDTVTSGFGTSSLSGVLVGLLWAMVGGIHTIFEPASLPLPKALKKWLLSLTIWTTAFFAVIAGAVWGGQVLATRLEFSVPKVSPLGVGLVGAAIAVIPAAFRIRRSNSLPTKTVRTPNHQGRIRYLFAAATILFGLALTAGVSPDFLGDGADQIIARGGELISGVETRFDRWTDELILWIYDRRAPAQSR